MNIQELGKELSATSYPGRGIVPVSYTHLDVYKRQVPHRAAHHKAPGGIYIKFCLRI